MERELNDVFNNNHKTVIEPVSRKLCNLCYLQDPRFESYSIFCNRFISVLRADSVGRLHDDADAIWCILWCDYVFPSVLTMNIRTNSNFYRQLTCSMFNILVHCSTTSFSHIVILMGRSPVYVGRFSFVTTRTPKHIQYTLTHNH